MGTPRWALAGALAAMCVAGIAARAQDAATQRQSEHTERANRDAAVADETSAGAHPRTANPDPSAGPRTNGAATGLSYGPVLAPRGRQESTGKDAAGKDAARKDPAEVHDETDTLARPAPQSGQQSGQPTKAQNRPVARRREAWQPEAPMAPRPLRSADGAPASVPVPIPPRVAAPAPVVPSSNPVNCAGGLCTTPSGNVNLGAGNAGVNSSGRLCARTGPNVQCF